MHDDFSDDDLLFLPRALTPRVLGDLRMERVYLSNYLLGELHSRIQPLLSYLAEPIPHSATWRYQGYKERQAHEHGILLADCWDPLPALDGFRVYVRDSGYALVFREQVLWGQGRGRKAGGWQAVLRYLPLADASAALGSIAGVLETLTLLAPRISGLSRVQGLASRAGKMAYWCREIPKEVKKLGLV